MDGLRALAVLPVILFHAGFQIFSGGFVGVDVFFVISGYLITTIILTELEQGKFSIINFYERRARRILPALFFVMAISIPFAWILLSPFDLASFSKSLVATPLFFSNFFFWIDGGYFETTAELKPLIHTWSLAVEEQYYIFFPIFLILSWKLGRSCVVKLILIIAILSLLAAQFGASYKPVANFFLLPTRAWELAIGALISFYFSNTDRVDLTLKSRQFLSGFGVGLIILPIFIFNKDTPFPSFYTLIPTVGAAFILLFCQSDTAIGKILGSKLFVSIGLISYSAYLWHQPIFALSRYYFSTISLMKMSALVICTLLLAALSWKYIERPFRNKNIVSRKIIFSFSLIVSFIFIVFGVASANLFGSSSNSGIEAKIAKALLSTNAVYSSNMDERKFIKYRIQYENLSPDVIVLGSSRIMQIGEHNYASKVINLGVSGSSIEDDIAIADLATKKFQPSTIVIGLDPWLFNAKSGQGRWKSLNDEYFSALSALQDKPNSSLINIQKTEIKESRLVKFSANLYNSINTQKFDASNDTPENRDKIRRDGSRVYNTTYASKTKNEIDSGLDDLLNYAMATYDYSKKSEAVFEDFINHYSRLYKVVLILPPYHPKLYERMKNERQIYLKIESQFRDLAKKHGIQIIGSYDPNKVGCSSADFYDGMHPKDVCIGKVMSELNRSE
nr:acyltransferase [Crenothrix polyspora]